jgi:ABC-type dipeptide/oligopeptide/nickel transport system permease component
VHWRFVARRLGILMASMFIASFVIFAALYLAPGNPVAALSGGRPLPPGSIRVLDQRYHLNGNENCHDHSHLTGRMSKAPKAAATQSS